MAGEWRRLRLLTSLLWSRRRGSIMSTTEYSTLHSITDNIPQHPAVKTLTTTHGEVSVAGCPQQSTIIGIINTTLIFGTFCPLHLNGVHMERQTIITTPQRLSSTNNDIIY